MHAEMRNILDMGSILREQFGGENPNSRMQDKITMNL